MQPISAHAGVWRCAFPSTVASVVFATSAVAADYGTQLSGSEITALHQDVSYAWEVKDAEKPLTGTAH